MAMRDQTRETFGDQRGAANDENIQEVRAGTLFLGSPASSEGYLSYQGPTSIYRLGATHDVEVPNTGQQGITPSLYCSIVSEEPAVDEVLRSFFRWQYHAYMFIYREAFLLDYLNHEYEGRYCSRTLVYAICALGCLPGKDENGMMTHYMRKAYSGMSSLETLRIDSTTIQALLSLAYCELAIGNIAKVWLLSG